MFCLEIKYISLHLQKNHAYEVLNLNICLVKLFHAHLKFSSKISLNLYNDLSFNDHEF